MIAEVTISSDVCSPVPQRPDVSPVPGSVRVRVAKTHIFAVDLSQRVRT